MMDCRAVEQNMSLHLDGELDPRTRLAVEVHLRRCAHCQDTYAKLGHISLSLGQQRILAPDDFDFSLQSRLRRMEMESLLHSRRRPSRFRRGVLAAAVLLGLLAGGLYTFVSVSRMEANSQQVAQQRRLRLKPSSLQAGSLASLVSFEDGVVVVEPPDPPNPLLIDESSQQPSLVYVSY